MIIFKKKHVAEKNDNSREYFINRDSLTGHMNRAFACKEYERVRRGGKYGAVMVRLSGSDDMPYYKAEACIKEAGEIIARICNEEISRVENGDFLIFTENAPAWEEKLSFFLKELSDDDARYAVAADMLDPNEDFDLFFGRIRRHVGAVEISNMVQML